MHENEDLFALAEKSQEKEGGDPTQWMLSFIDLISLLTSFFVLLYSMSGVKTEEFKKISESLSNALNPGTLVAGSIQKAKEMTVTKNNNPNATRLDYLYSLIYDRLNALAIPAKIKLTRYDDRIVLSLFDDDTFVQNSAELTAQAKATIPLLADMLASLPNQIEVIAGPDMEASDKSSGYNSGWDLAVARALTVSEIINSKGYLGAINSFGRLSSYEENAETGLVTKYKFARRIDIVIEDKKAKEF